MERSGGAGACVLAIDDRDAADAHLAQYDLAAHAFLPGDQTSHRVADHGGFDELRFGSRRGERIVHRVARQYFHAGVEVFAELDHSGTDNRYVAHSWFLHDAAGS